MTNQIKIPVAMTNEPSAECIPAGNLSEHNTTELLFTLDSEFTADYKYFLEFVLPDGKIFRTDYLTPATSDNSISFLIPASITQFGCADCYFNAVKIDADSITQQLIKPKTVTLLFSSLYNANNELLEQYDFSVNTLLEDIKNGVFKGDKGDSGNDYVLTTADKTEIANQISTSGYGLPFTRKISGTGTANISDSLEQALKSLTVSGISTVSKTDPNKDISPDNLGTVKGLSDIKVISNGIESNIKLDSELFSFGNYRDKADLINGEITSAVSPYIITGNEALSYVATYTSGDISINRFYLSLPSATKMMTGNGLPGFCTHFEIVDSYIPSSDVLSSIISSGGKYIGIWFGQANDVIYFFSDMSYADLKSFFTAQYSAGTPVKVYFPMANAVSTKFTPITVQTHYPSTKIEIQPKETEFSIDYCADISAAIKKLEEKL